MPITTTDFTDVNGGTTPGPSLGGGSILIGANFTGLTNYPTGSGIGNGLQARQILGLSALAPCPDRDCRDDVDCFKISVFGGSNIDPAQNDYSTFMLEYPYSGGAPWFDQNVSKWTLLKQVGGLYAVQEVLTYTSTVCEFLNFDDFNNHFIYFHCKLLWDEILAEYGEGTYYLKVESIIGGEKAIQCSDLFVLKDNCCDKVVNGVSVGTNPPEPDPDETTCQHGVKNGEFDASDGWGLYQTTNFQWIISDGQLTAWTPVSMIGSALVVTGTTCMPMTDGLNYTVDFDVTINPGEGNVQLIMALGQGLGTPITASGTYSQTITADTLTLLGSTPILNFRVIENGGLGNVGNASITFNYIRIDSLVPPTPLISVNLANANFDTLGQTFNPSGLYYPLPGWTELGGTIHWTNTFPLEPGVLYAGLGGYSSGDYSLLKATVSPALTPGLSYDVTLNVLQCDANADFTILLGGTAGTPITVAGEVTETIVCGGDGTGLVIRARANANILGGVGKLDFVAIEGLTSQPEPEPGANLCYGASMNGTFQFEVAFGGVISALPDGTVFDFKKTLNKSNGAGTTLISGDAGFNDMIRVPGIFGFQESGEEKIDIRFNSGFVKNIRQEIIRSYTAKTDPLPIEIINRMEIYGRFANQLFISDYNDRNPDWKIKKKSIRIDSDWKPNYETMRKACSRLVPIEFKCLDRVRNVEKRIC